MAAKEVVEQGVGGRRWLVLLVGLLIALICCLVYVKCKRNLFTHGALRSSQELVQKCRCIPGSN